jgi:hypothetical protein
MSIPLCNYPKPDGIPCGSPALRGRHLCYYHQRDYKRHQHSDKVLRQLDVLGPRLPRMRNLAAVQDALYQIMNAVLDHRIDPDRAGCHLFALQQTSGSLRKSRQTGRRR